MNLTEAIAAIQITSPTGNSPVIVERNQINNINIEFVGTQNDGFIGIFAIDNHVIIKEIVQFYMAGSIFRFSRLVAKEQKTS